MQQPSNIVSDIINVVRKENNGWSNAACAEVIRGAIFGEKPDFQKEDDPSGKVEIPWALIKFLLSQPEIRKYIHPSGVRLSRARIISDGGRYDFVLCESLVPLVLEKCEFHGRLFFEFSRLKSLSLMGSTMHGIQLDSARLEGALSFDDCVFNEVGKLSIKADELKTGGRVSLRRCTALGGVRLTSSDIGGDLDAAGAFLVSINFGKYLYTRKFHVANASVQNHTTARKCINNNFDKSTKEIEDCLKDSLSDTIAPDCREPYQYGDLQFKALDLYGASIAGNVKMRRGFISLGEVSLNSARIGSSVLARGAFIFQPDGVALSMDGATIRMSLYLQRDDGPQYRVTPNMSGTGPGMEREKVANALERFSDDTGGSCLAEPEGDFLIRDIGRTTRVENLRKIEVVSGRQSIVLDTVARIDKDEKDKKPFISHGAVSMRGAMISQRFVCNDVRFRVAPKEPKRLETLLSNPMEVREAYTLFAKRLHVGGDVILNKMLLEGRNTEAHSIVIDDGMIDSYVSLENAQIGGRLFFRGTPNLASHVDKGPPFLNLDFARVTGAVRLEIKVLGPPEKTPAPTEGARARRGPTRTDDSSYSFYTHSRSAGHLADAEVRRSTALVGTGATGDENAEVIVALRSATAGSIDLHECDHDYLEWKLEGLKYNAVDNYTECRGGNKAGVDAWIATILRAPIQPYDAFISFLNEVGDEVEARNVAIAKENIITGNHRVKSRNRRAAMPPSRLLTWTFLHLYLFWRGVTRYTVFYGYNPMRAIAWFITLWFVGAGLFWYASSRSSHVMFPNKAIYYTGDKHTLGQLYPCKNDTSSLLPSECLAPEGYPPFNPILYSFELATPVPELGQQEHWNIEGDYDWRSLRFWMVVYKWFHTGVGWFLSFMILLSPTTLLRRE